LLCFPLYELNSWGGYSNILSLTFMVLMFLYLSLMKNGIASSVVIFVFAFSVVLSHQLVAFLTFVILPPVVIVLLIKSKTHHSKSWLAALLGGATAFFLYYFQAILPHFGILIEHVFFQIKTNLYQLSFVSPQAFAVNFGFVFIFGCLGMILAFVRLRKERNLIFLLFLSLGVLVPLIFSQSYLLGLYLPYQMFTYYMVPSLVVLAAVTFSCLISSVHGWYYSNRMGRKRTTLKIISIIAVCVLVVVMVVRIQTVMGKIGEGTKFYSTSDLSAYDAGSWLRENYPEEKTVVVTEKPGSWFGVFSGKYTIAQTHPSVERVVIAETVLDLAYEVEYPLTLIRTYESKSYISNENYVDVNGIWRRVSYFPEENDKYITFSDKNGITYNFSLSTLNRNVVFDDENEPKKLVLRYSHDDFVLTESLLFQNDSYPITVTWAISSNNEIENVALYISCYFDLSLAFEKAYIPGILDWENPWDRPSQVQANKWAVVDFSHENLTSNYIGLYDEKNQVAFGLRFMDTPVWGDVGALSSRQIDALRFEYRADNLDVNQTVFFTYQFLTFYQNSYAAFQQPYDLASLFNHTSYNTFEIKCRDFVDYIREYNIAFLVYDAEHFDRSLLRSSRLHLVYSNNGCVICKIETNLGN
jgi:hypothetical protein